MPAASSRCRPNCGLQADTLYAFCVLIRRDKVERMVHLLVFSEEELRQQDMQFQAHTTSKALCSGGAEMGSSAGAASSS